MKLSYKDTLFATSSNHRSLDEIIQDIKTGVYKELVDEIRDSENKEQAVKLKKQLPTFFVGVVLDGSSKSVSTSKSVSSTGIIQFDLDDYDLEKSKSTLQRINKHPSTLYSFLSPNGGIKFGVMTDFVCNDKDTIGHKHKLAYTIVKDAVADLLKGYEVDEATSSVSQTCLFSYDDNAFLNKSAEKLKVNSQVDKEYKQAQAEAKARLKIQSKYNKTTDDDEVLEALNHIPKDLRYDNRLDINFSVIDHFGNRAKALLLGHWNKKDKKKLEGQIDSQIKSHARSIGNKITIGTLINEAKKYGYIGNKIISKQTSEEPTYHAEKYYTPDEATTRLEEIIHKNFFQDKKDKMVMVECGSGKTRTMYKTISKFLLDNPNKTVAIFLKTHEMMEQFVSDMEENIKSYNKQMMKDSGGGVAGMRNKYSFTHRPHRIKGMTTEREEFRETAEEDKPKERYVCREVNREGSGINYDKNNPKKSNVDVIGTTKCDGCWHKLDGCEYWEQYEEYFGKISNVRVYTHNRLFLKPKADRNVYWDKIVVPPSLRKMIDEKDLPEQPTQYEKHYKEWKADYVIVDEDIVSMMTNLEETLLGVSQTKHQSLITIMDNLGKGQELIEATASIGTEIHNDYKGLEKSLEKDKQDKSSIHKQYQYGKPPKPLPNHMVETYRRLCDKIERKEKEMCLFEELLHISNGIKLQSKYVWIHRSFDKDTGALTPPRLTYGKAKEILGEYKNVPILYLDATGEQVVIDSLFDKRFEIENIRVQQQGNVKVYQFINNASFSRKAFGENSKLLDDICGWLETLETERLGLIRYMRVKNDKKFFQPLDGKVNGMNGGDKNVIGWFGNVRGINRFEECDTLVVLGRQKISNHAIYNLSQLIFRQDIYDDGNSKYEEKAYEDYLAEEVMNKVFRMKNGNHKSIGIRDYKTPECFYTSNHFDKAETYQALHRLRLIHGTDNKNVFLITDCVVDVSVDELLDRFQELGEKSIAVIKHIKDHKFILDTKEAFIEGFGWKDTEATDFRLARRFGDWMKNHRSLASWKYHTKDRKTGKAYSWNNQSKDDVENWLASNHSLDIKKIEMI
jgi:hypothetical protein